MGVTGARVGGETGLLVVGGATGGGVGGVAPENDTEANPGFDEISMALTVIVRGAPE